MQHLILEKYNEAKCGSQIRFDIFGKEEREKIKDTSKYFNNFFYCIVFISIYFYFT